MDGGERGKGSEMTDVYGMGKGEGGWKMWVGSMASMGGGRPSVEDQTRKERPASGGSGGEQQRQTTPSIAGCCSR
jgi:hypothetical protein